jgi:hypothetical protein
MRRAAPGHLSDAPILGVPAGHEGGGRHSLSYLSIKKSYFIPLYVRRAAHQHVPPRIVSLAD